MPPRGNTICESCGATGATSANLEPFKPCPSCANVWYCSPECQKIDSAPHLFECKGYTNPSTHHLTLALNTNTLPNDEKTQHDYGFIRAGNWPTQSGLLDLYRDLVTRLNVSMETICSWAEREQLAEEIAVTYERIPIDSRGTHYYWFLAHKSIFDANDGELGSHHTPTQPERRCAFCRLCEGEKGKDETYQPIIVGPLKKCSGCKEVWYCSRQCQRNDWSSHKFDCKPKLGLQVSPADYLARAVAENLIPDDQKTCEYFGFDRAFTSEARSKLLGVYIGLINFQEIPVKEISRWREEGRLLQGIKDVFEKIPAARHGGYYPWLMENQYILDPTLPDSHTDLALEMFRKGFKYAGLPPPMSIDHGKSVVATFPEDHARCLNLAIMLLLHLHPSPQDRDYYVIFGFCACPREEYEMRFGSQWIQLLNLCTFDELLKAYRSASMLRLFELHGLPITDPATIDVLLHSPIMHKSVWPLKQFVLGTEDSEVRPTNSVWADYGFMNCSTDAEMLELKSLYKAVFRDGDPLELHKACLAGKLYDYVNRFCKVTGKKKKAKYARLLKNLYPLAM